MSIAEIFSCQGEAGFREREYQVLCQCARLDAHAEPSAPTGRRLIVARIILIGVAILGALPATIAPPDILKAFLKAWDDLAAEHAKNNPFFKKVADSQKKFANLTVPYWTKLLGLYEDLGEAAIKK